MLTCHGIDLYFIDDLDHLDMDGVYEHSGHILLFEKEAHLSAFLHHNSLPNSDELLFKVHVFDDLTTGEQFFDNGFTVSSGKFAVMAEDTAVFSVISGEPESIMMFLYQFEEHKVAEVHGNMQLFIAAKNDEELICRTADAYQVVIAFISS
jgi:hypothetical protein